MYGETNGTTWRRTFCRRCGEFYDNCFHLNTIGHSVGGEEAERIRARYAIGALHNPDHDTTDYTDQGAGAATLTEL